MKYRKTSGQVVNVPRNDLFGWRPLTVLRDRCGTSQTLDSPFLTSVGNHLLSRIRGLCRPRVLPVGRGTSCESLRFTFWLVGPSPLPQIPWPARLPSEPFGGPWQSPPLLALPIRSEGVTSRQGRVDVGLRLQSTPGPRDGLGSRRVTSRPPLLLRPPTLRVPGPTHVSLWSPCEILGSSVGAQLRGEVPTYVLTLVVRLPPLTLRLRPLIVGEVGPRLPTPPLS